jgi:hypothetical protein
VRRVKATRDETQTPEQIIEDLGKLEAAVKLEQLVKKQQKLLVKEKGRLLLELLLCKLRRK